MLLGPGAATDFPPHMPIRGMEQSHGGTEQVIAPDRRSGQGHFLGASEVFEGVGGAIDLAR